ncbi:hypothetical protein [uncultured Microscilla sp.]|uniref:hypothetical protein n=1 Tax=uncultured Microscilla sp. TaxID=432653 RepID=UPI00261C5162|nr:hypothetical protein [uncultured Microscilla sp.]
MQSKHAPLNNQTQWNPETAIFAENIRYSLQRRLENLIAVGQDSLELLRENHCINAREAENHWVLLEDHLQLIRNDWAMLEWLQK